MLRPHLLQAMSSSRKACGIIRRTKSDNTLKHIRSIYMSLIPMS